MAEPGSTAGWSLKSWTSRDGLTLSYRDYPGNETLPPLLCLHGLTRNARDFEDFASQHAGRFRVITPDFRGRGASAYDPQPSRYSPATYAADILQLLDELEIARAVFVGTSLGGLVTMLIAAVQPDRIAAAVLNDIGPELDPRGLERIRSYVGKPKHFRDWDEAADYTRAINGGLPANHGQEQWLAAARRICKPHEGAIVLDYDMAIAEPFHRPSQPIAFDMWPAFRQLGRAPLLIVRGENSDLLSAESAAKMHAEAPGAKLVTVPDVGHAPSLAEPAAAAAIDAFLSRVGTAGSAA